MKTTQIDKITEIKLMIESSPSFVNEYGQKIKLIKYILPLLNQDVIDKIYAFLILEKNKNK